MTAENWLLAEGRVYRLVEAVDSESAAEKLSESLSENCIVIVSRRNDGKWGVYWRPKVGNLCPYGVV
jgi:hypothetical protein